MHPDLEWLEPPESPDRTVVRGREAGLSAMILWLSAWASYENDLRGITEYGDRAILHFRQRVTGKGSGVSVEGDLFMVWTVREGLATRMAMFTRESEALADAGVG
jgi:ketosteroid isomerase-like protein